MKRIILNILLAALVFSATGCYSCESWNSAWGNGPRENYPAGIAFWDKDCKPIAKAAPKPEPKPAAPASKPEPSTCGPSVVTRTYPCGDCGVVKLEKVMPREVQQNAPFTYDITVMNMTDMEIADVVVTEHVDENFEYKSSSPSAKVMDGKLIWVMDSIDAQGSEKITITGMAKNADCLKHCATITYVVPACANVKVVQPALRLVKSAPAEVLLCDPIPVKIVVTNTGTGTAENVRITDMLPEGLMTVDGKRSVTLDAGTLGAGQSREFAMTLKASKTGKYVNSAMATSSGGLKSEASSTTIVRQPVLAITKTGPEKIYLGRSVEYQITVANKGDAPAQGLMVEDKLETGAKFVSATNGGQLSAGKVVWNLGSLAPGDSRKLSVTVMPGEFGTTKDVATAMATCAEGVSASAQTAVEGIAAVLLEVIDVSDPIEVGGTETYQIVVTNQGSIPDTNIKIVCTLEENQQYVSSSGATSGTAQGNTVTFAPLPSLAAKAKATWLVNVKAVKAGDVRFTTVMDTDQLQRPVQETEATHIYE